MQTTWNYAATLTDLHWSEDRVIQQIFIPSGFTNVRLDVTFTQTEGVNPAYAGLRFYDSTGASVSTYTGNTNVSSGTPASVTYCCSPTGGYAGCTYTGNYPNCRRIDLLVGNSWTDLGGGSFTFLLTADTAIFPDPVYCAYGTQPNPTASIWTFLTGAMVDLIAAWMGLGPLGIMALDTMVGMPLLGYDCSKPQPTPPTITDADYLPGTGIPSPGSMDKWMQLVRVGVWHFYCQCSPAPSGQPAPVAYPPPALPPPLTTGTQPAPTCSNSDICTTLNEMERMLSAMNQTLMYTRKDVQTIQRNRVPFAYVAETSHSGLSGQGTIAVSRTIGFQVVVTTVPPGTKILPGDPVYLWDMGWMSISDADGMLAEKRITRQSHTWVPDDCQLATEFSYYLNPGVVIGVVPLDPEP